MAVERPKGGLHFERREGEDIVIYEDGKEVIRIHLYHVRPESRKARFQIFADRARYVVLMGHRVLRPPSSLEVAK